MEKYIIKLIECFVNKDDEKFNKTVDEICVELNSNNREDLTAYIISLLYPDNNFIPM